MNRVTFWLDILKSGKRTEDKLNIFSYMAKLLITSPLNYTKKLHFQKNDILVETKDGLFFCRSKTNDLMMSHVSYEKELKKYMNIKKGTCLDIGSHMGRHTIPMAKNLDGFVIAIEPEESNLNSLWHNVELNNLKNVVIFEGACSSIDGKAKLYLSDCDGLHSLKNKTKKSVEVNINKVDTLLKRVKVPPVALVKLDAEGAEYDVLVGMANTIRKDHPRILFEAVEDTFPLCERLLLSFGYTVSPIKGLKYYYLGEKA